MNITISFLLLSLLPFVANADECTREIPEPVVVNHEDINNYVLSELKERTLTESFTINSGQKITIIQSGCHNFGLTYQFEINNLSEEDIISNAIKLFIPTINIAPSYNNRRIIDALESREGKPFINTITIIEGYEWLHVSQSQDNGTNLINLVYNIAL